MAPRDKAFERDELLSLVSHEMKNPLTSITGYTMFAEDAVKNHDHELALESLQVVRAETQRVLRLAEDLLDSAQVSAGRFSIKMDAVDLKEIVERIAGRYCAVTGREIDVVVASGFPRLIGDGDVVLVGLGVLLAKIEPRLQDARADVILLLERAIPGSVSSLSKQREPKDLLNVTQESPVIDMGGLF